MLNLGMSQTKKQSKYEIDIQPGQNSKRLNVQSNNKIQSILTLELNFCISGQPNMYCLLNRNILIRQIGYFSCPETAGSGQWEY